MRTRRTRLLIAAVPATGLALIAAGGVAFGHATPTRAEAELAPYTASHTGVIVDAGVTGEARTVSDDGRSTVRLKAEGLAAGAAYGVHVHSGRCSDFGPHFKFDPLGPGTRDNEVWLDLHANASGRARDRVTVRPLPIGQPYSVVIHALSNPDQAPVGEPGHPGARIACGDLEAGL